MNYPVELLPTTAYKKIDCDVSGHFLMRFTNTSNLDEIWDDETNTIRVDQIYFPSERVSDLSLSLHGVYQKGHIFLMFTEAGQGKYMHYCEPDANVETPVFETDFLLNANRHFWCIPIGKIAGESFEYNVGNEKFKAQCMVLHTPMRWNYWHYSLRWQTNEGSLEDMEQKAWKKLARKIGHAVRTAIVHFVTIEEPEIKLLPDPCYKKN